MENENELLITKEDEIYVMRYITAVLYELKLIDENEKEKILAEYC